MPDKKYEALYHPLYLPDENWTKLQLLFWDKIARIVPYPMQSLFGDSIIEEKFKIDPNILPPLEPYSEDLKYFDNHIEQIKRAFDSIKQNKLVKFDSLENFGVHPGKAPDWIFKYLEKLELAKLIEIGDKNWSKSHHNVNPIAGELILSCLGSSMAKRNNLHSITNIENNFYLTAINNLNSSAEGKAEELVNCNIGLSILEAKVPRDLHNISFQDILKFKSDYQPLKESFHKVMEDLNDINNYKGIKNQKEFKDFIESRVANYKKEYDKFDGLTQRSLKFIRDWKVQAIGSTIGTFGKDIAGERVILGNVLKAVGYGLSMIGKIPIKNFGEEKEKSFQYLQFIGKTIEAKNAIESIKPYLLKVKI